MSNSDSPTAWQLAATRLAHWHQNAQPLLTLEALRDWISVSGLVLYAPRAQQLPTPAPSFVEAVLGAANAAPTLAETEEPRSLLTRLIAEGAVIPLSLLGTQSGSETPDFLVSPAAFSFIFTLRGDKAWKQPPATSGATKVSPLALAAYNLLAQKVTLSAYDLATELGKEVTETAVLRALTELWQHLRVLPVLQPDGAATLWELTTTRYTRQIKAGANAGQPTALSALISLYLGQAILPTEEEVETFLSPLTARSRIREVVHALVAARQLETIVIEGKTALHITGELPTFEPVAVLAPEEAESAIVATTEEEVPQSPRIGKFVPKPRRDQGGFASRPAARSFDRTDRERRPFRREAKPDYTKPWDEEKTRRAARPFNPTDSEGIGTESSDRPRRFDRPAKPYGSRPSFGSKAAGKFGGKPSFRRDDRESESGERKPFKKPFSSREGSPRKREDFGQSRPPRRDFGESRPPRRDFSESRPPRRDFGESRPPRRDFGESRPPRRDFGESRPPRRDFGESRPPRRDFGESRPPRRDFGGSKPAFSPRRGERQEFGPRSDRPARKFAPRGKDIDRAPSGEASERPTRFAAQGDSEAPRRSFGAKKPFAKSGGGFAGKPKSFGGKKKFGEKGKPGFSSAKPYGKKPFGKSGGKSAPGSDKPAGKSGPFQKFMGEKKPFAKRKPRPE
ncbi:YML083C domain-containing protein [Edaphobacter bradus]|uniref:hypothetical protein n=1 Tax=Edaphobacter bradus TaxID=2259016 RepID=UPI0021E03EF4|nr:hypothetical protein [Edaphobacter bradus]